MACWLEYHNSHECGSQYRDSCEWQEKLADISRGKFSVLVRYWGGGGGLLWDLWECQAKFGYIC